MSVDVSVLAYLYTRSFSSRMNVLTLIMHAFHFADVWTAAAKEGLAIYLRGQPVYFEPPQDLPERMVDFVLHVLGALSLLVMAPGTAPVWPPELSRLWFEGGSDLSPGKKSNTMMLVPLSAPILAP
jgi:hypothetical protein